MVGTTGGTKFASLVKIKISLESGCRDESKYVLLNNIAPQFILKIKQISLKLGIDAHIPLYLGIVVALFLASQLRLTAALPTLERGVEDLFGTRGARGAGNRLRYGSAGP